MSRRHNLSQQFLKSFAGRDLITTQEIFDWYKQAKKGLGRAQRSSIYELIIDPLIESGMMERVNAGLYYLSFQPIEEEEESFDIRHIDDVDSVTTDDEWDEYIKNKLKEV